jgi:beta-galactosidase
MNPFTFDSQTYRIDSKPVYLLSGEFHYFRVPKSDWRTRMRLFKEAGGNCLATYIPWLLHEPKEGTFRFYGEDWLDLEGFLQTAQEEGLYVIARPGPYQYSELVYHGLPGWLVENYPEVLALDLQGKVIGYGSVSYTHPLFLEKVRTWFSAVCPILSRYTVSRGGPVAFTQIDNEMVGIHEWFGSLDYHPVTMGFGQLEGKYPNFLRNRYETIQSLNRRYGTDFQSFSDARPQTLPAGSAEGIRQRKDYFDFYLSTITDYAQILVGLLREFGIDTPIVHNSANPGMNAYFEPVASRLGSQFLLGSDHYYTLGQDWPQNNPTPQYAARVFVSLEMLRLMGYPPSVFELPGGSCSNWPPITPTDARTCYLTNLAFGMKGSNYYIFTGGPNPPGAGTTTDLYDYDASIGANGEVRPLFTAQKEFGQVAHDLSNLLTGSRLFDFRIGMDLEYARSEVYWKERGDWLFSPPEAWQLMRRGILTTALCASLSPSFVNLANPDWVLDTSTPVVIASSASMSRAIQKRLVDFVEAGGKLLLTPILPSLDENMEPYSLLADFIGTGRFETNQRGVSHPQVKEVSNVMGSLFFSDPLPGGAEAIGVDTLTGRTFGWKKVFPYGGCVVVLGLSWSHSMREHERMLRSLLEDLGLKPVVTCSNPNLWTSAVWDGSRGTLFILNLFTAPMEGEIEIHMPEKTVSFGPIQVAPMDVGILEF